MVKQCVLQANGTTAIVTGGPEDSIKEVVQATHVEYRWLREQERAEIFAPHQ